MKAIITGVMLVALCGAARAEEGTICDPNQWAATPNYCKLLSHNFDHDGGTIIDTFIKDGKFVGYVKFFGNHEWRFYDYRGKHLRTVDDREEPTLCLERERLQ
jgi:hypothetical protein